MYMEGWKEISQGRVKNQLQMLYFMVGQYLKYEITQAKWKYLHIKCCQSTGVLNNLLYWCVVLAVPNSQTLVYMGICFWTPCGFGNP